MSVYSALIKKIISHSVERKLRDFRDVYLRRYHIEKLPDEIFDTKIKQHSISFCTTCMNRIFHLKKTIIRNIEDNLEYPNAEFVLINYNSQDGLHTWAQKNLTKYIEMGRLNYFYTDQPQFFHVSIAKNLAHKAAQGEIVCNVDGDNFTGRDFAFYINYLYNKYGMDALLHFKKKPFWGTEGRILMSKKNFEQLGGYDENFLPTGHEDHDLVNRAIASDLKYYNIQIENFLQYLSNTKEEKSMNFEDENADYYQLEHANKKTSDRNIENGILVANKEQGWGKVPVYKNFSSELIYL